MPGSSSASDRRERLHFAFGAMGSPCEIIVDADDETLARETVRGAIAEVARLDRKYSHYSDDSYLADITRRANTESVELDDETCSLFDFADVLHRESGGAFDISCGALTRAWDLRAGKPPADEVQDAARARVGWSGVDYRRPNLRVPPGTVFDLGGLVKEYAVDRACAVLAAAGLKHALVELGGDVGVTGPCADGAPWRVGIRDPADFERALLTVPLAAGGLATSGDYARGFEYEGHRYTHVIDVATGRPVQGFASVTVTAASCFVAGAIATVALLLGRGAGDAWLTQSGAPHAGLARDGARFGPLWESSRSSDAGRS